MSSLSDEDVLVPHPAPPVPNEEQDFGYSSLAKAFRCLLVAVLFPGVSGLLAFVNVVEHWLEGDYARLCGVTGNRQCSVLMTIPLILGPLTALFIFATFFLLDHYLSISPAFRQSKLRTETALGEEDQVPPHDVDPATPQAQSGAPNSRIEAALYASAVLKIITVIAYLLAGIWAVSSLADATNASLVIILDAPFGHEWRERTKFSFRVVLGYVQATFDGLLAYYMGKTAALLWRSRRSVELACAAENVGMDLAREGTHRGSRTRFLEVYRSQRSTLEKSILLLLVSFTLSTVSGIFVAYHLPFSHLRRVDPFWYISLCSLTFLFSWSTTLTFHTYRTSGILPRERRSIVVSSISLLLAVVWVLASSTYLILWARGLSCRREGNNPLPPDSPCLYIRASKFWTGAVAGVLGYLQAWILGATGVTLWRARIGIRLREGDDGEQGVAGEGSS